MPWQLIYTSAPRGLLSGQSGFCTVARSEGLREALAQRLEQLSYYHYIRVAEAATPGRNPSVCAFRLLDLRGSKYYVLTRIQPCGLDFTARTNHVAHHLVFQPGELSRLPSPAALFRFWEGWQTAWTGDPQILPELSPTSFAAAEKFCLPAQTWLRVTGDAGRAAGLLEGECARGCYLLSAPDTEQQALNLFCETLQLLNLNQQFPLRPWRHPFTTFLQAEDNPVDFNWRACQEGTPAHQVAVQRTAVLLPWTSVRAPGNTLAKIAREGPKPVAAPPPPAAASTAEPKADPVKLTLQEKSARSSQNIASPSSSPWDEQDELQASSNTPRPKFNSRVLTSLGAVIAIVLALFFLSNRFARRHSNSPDVEELPNAHATNLRPESIPHANEEPNSASTPDAAELNPLLGQGPNYFFVVNNLNDINLNPAGIGPLQNLLHRFDQLEIRPTDLRLSLLTDQWDGASPSVLNVQQRATKALAANTGHGIAFTLDYANWIEDPSNQVIRLRNGLSSAEGEFSIQFNYSEPGKGEPFRLLFLTSNNPPAPARLSLGWVKSGFTGVRASLRPPLSDRLLESFILPPDSQWQLRPFIHSGRATVPRYLYQGLAKEDAPATDAEMDFAQIKKRLAARQAKLQPELDAVMKNLDGLVDQSALNSPLGKTLGTTGNLSSLSSFRPEPSANDFITYLNRVRHQTDIRGWPTLDKDDDDTTLQQKFREIYAVCAAKFSEANRSLLQSGATNYFSALWGNLKAADKIRLEKKRLQGEITLLQTRRNEIPESADALAEADLFIIDSHGLRLNMIRFIPR